MFGRLVLTMLIVGSSAGIALAQNFDLINQPADNQAQAQDDQHTQANTPKFVQTTKDEVLPATVLAAQAKMSNQNKSVAPAETQSAASEATEQTSKYTLGIADVIEVAVMRHPEVSNKYTLNSEGKIQLDFAGDIQLTGLTKEEAAAEIGKHLVKYIINPEVTVKIVEYNSKVVYVVGEVGLPGKIFMRGDTITVRDALLSAGLPQLTAKTTDAMLFTPSADGHVVEKRVNVYALLYKGDLRENYVMRPGDTLYLPATLWAKVARFINPVAQPIGAAAGTSRTVAVGF